MSVWVFVDGNVATLTRIADWLVAGSHRVSVSLLGYQLRPGHHSASFHVVNDIGSISNVQNLSFEIIPGPTRTTARTPTITRSPLASQTLAPFPTPFPTTHPIVWSWALSSVSNFDIKWQNGA
jgi:hypothetical protein